MYMKCISQCIENRGVKIGRLRNDFWNLHGGPFKSTKIACDFGLFFIQKAMFRNFNPLKIKCIPWAHADLECHSRSRAARSVGRPLPKVNKAQ